uniref:ATP-dependent DNA helicase n=1 Tax=Caenorhabditis japonica TaxID=281687 RepID=A0A8R1IDE1_CAEJA
MRIINGDANWIKFLLDVGDGVANDYEDRVALLEGLPVLEDLVDDVFGGSNKEKDTFVPRITCYEDKNLPFHLKRTQFPVKLAFAISINKAQGQSFGRVELYLPEDVFAHGQTYVARSNGDCLFFKRFFLAREHARRSRLLRLVSFFARLLRLVSFLNVCIGTVPKIFAVECGAAACACYQWSTFAPGHSPLLRALLFPAPDQRMSS